MAVAASTSRQVEIRLLGEPGIYVGRTYQDIKLPAKSFEVLCMLALQAGQPTDRAKLAFTLWPDDSEECAKANLRRYLYLLRRAISRADESQLVATSGTIMWKPDGTVTIDVVEFLRLSEDPDSLERAVALYHGDLLANLYEEWLEEPRQRLRSCQLQNLLALSNRHLHVDDKRALEYADGARRLEPWDEEAVRCIMRARTNLGDRSGAVQEYSEFAQRLREEFGTEPAHETKQALEDAKIAESSKSNLPRQLTSFVGREEVLSEIIPLIEKSPLVTLVGAGGVGKTRCAVEAAAQLLDAWTDGVWLVELAPISDPSLVSGVVARALGVQESPARPILDTLIAYLKRKRLLLIIDNCEHVIAEARRAVTAILHECPEVRVLATSRESLAISGEQVYHMPSLSVPPAGRSLQGQEVLRFSAPLLFNDRARSADVHFRITGENAHHVAEICRRLDGIPLAIELAAARLNVLSAEQLAQKLDDRFRLLIGGDRCALPRHRTMRALIDWSYDLLSDEDRTMFRRLSIFVGGFTLESANAVWSDTADEIETLNLLSSLVDKSLVQFETDFGGTRYRLLEATRQYAHERLKECGEYASIAHAHATAFLALAERFAGLYETIPDRVWKVVVAPDMENWRAALDWALTRGGDIALGQRMVGALQRMWVFFAPAEGRRWIQAALATTDENTPDQVMAELDLAESQLDRLLHRYEAGYNAAQRSRARFERVGDSRGAAEAKMLAARHLIVLGRVGESERLLEAALATAEQLGFQKLLCSVLDCLAFARDLANDIDGARTRYAQALEIARAAGSERTAAIVASNFGEMEFRCGNAQAAIQLASESLEGHRALDTANFALELCYYAAYRVALGDFDDARRRAREALSISRDAQFEVCLSFALARFSAIAALRPHRNAEDAKHDRMRAARLLGYAYADPKSEFRAWEYTEQREYGKAISALRDALGANELARLIQEGSAWSEDQAIAEAMLI
jgi:predicted ATPase/DNA-binding SARP family transcriptional activator